jgi:hypothetical protein
LIEWRLRTDATLKGSCWKVTDPRPLAFFPRVDIFTSIE